MLQLKFPSIKIDPNDPHRFDKLSRKPEVENLTDLVCNLKSPAVLAINSPWGTGKTTFVKMWEASLAEKSIHTLYFNAWETDFSEDPLISFLGEMNSGLESLIDSSDSTKEAWETTKALGKQIAKRGLPALIRVSTAGIIDTDKLIEDELSKTLEGLGSDALESYLKQKTAIASFHESLKALTAESPENLPVVIFVDELDRCKPTYAITVLERIKHLFNIEGLVFVLSIDKDQLCHSIGAVYGEGIDATGYLRRFIDFEYILRSPEKDAFIEFLFESLSLGDVFQPRQNYTELKYDEGHFLNTMKVLTAAYRLSLREIEQFLARINLSFRTAKENEFLHPALLVFLVFLKNREPELYQNFTSRDGTSDKIIAHLHRLFPGESKFSCFPCALIEGLLIAAKNDRWSLRESEPLHKHNEIRADESLDTEQRKYSDTVYQVATRPAGRLGNGVNLEKLVERLEVISRFQFQEPENEG
ncbi:KAP family P-loop NTPase fold protein [Marinobacter adhaerens]|uniref:KAP family P-loop NTPase fold protein n=1 Tax=Marinobacter adhaerens TaxID=1033846 RepID=UPI003F6E5372